VRPRGKRGRLRPSRPRAQRRLASLALIERIIDIWWALIGSFPSSKAGWRPRPNPCPPIPASRFSPSTASAWGPFRATSAALAANDMTARTARAEPSPDMAPKPAKPEPPIEQQVFRAEVAARFARLAAAPDGLVERLTLFWSNHFAVSVAKGSPLRVTAG